MWKWYIWNENLTVLTSCLKLSLISCYLQDRVLVCYMTEEINCDLSFFVSPESLQLSQTYPNQILHKGCAAICAVEFKHKYTHMHTAPTKASRMRLSPDTSISLKFQLMSHYYSSNSVLMEGPGCLPGSLTLLSFWHSFP